MSAPAGRQLRGRSLARLAAVQALYQMNYAQPDEARRTHVRDEFIVHRLGSPFEDVAYGDADRALFADLIEKVPPAATDLDATIAAVLPDGWTIARMDLVLRAILAAGTYELRAHPTTPARVVIDEYVDVANAFFDAAEVGFVNAVLDRIARTVRAGELDGDRQGPRPRPD